MSVGHCSEDQKSWRAFLKALAAVEEKIVYLHVGDEGNCNERELAAQLRIADRTRFLGRMSDVKTALYAADVFVMPSLHEGCGIAAIEAMACGLAVILSEVAGLEDFKDVSDDIIWTDTNSASIAHALGRAMRLDPAEPGAIGQRLHDAARNHFDVARGADAYARIYRTETRVTPSPCTQGEGWGEGLACK